VSGTTFGGLAQASKDFVNGKGVGSPELATNVVGASPGTLQGSRGNATPPNSELREVETPDPEVKVRKRRYLTQGYKLGVLKQVEKLRGKDGALGEFLRKDDLPLGNRTVS
jgi:hypothetical protein